MDLRMRLAATTLSIAACLPLATGCSELTGDDVPDGGPGPGPSGVCTTARTEVTCASNSGSMPRRRAV